MVYKSCFEVFLKKGSKRVINGFLRFQGFTRCSRFSQVFMCSVGFSGSKWCVKIKMGLMVSKNVCAFFCSKSVPHGVEQGLQWFKTGVDIING